MFRFYSRLKFNQKGIAPIFILLILAVGILSGLYLIRNPQIFSPDAAETGTNTVGIHRLYNAKYNTWYWADNQSDITNLIANGYQDEGVLFSAYTDATTPGTVPLYRLIKANDYYSPGHELFLTTSKQEVDLLLSQHNRAGRSDDMQNNSPNQAISSDWQIKDSALYVYPPTYAPQGALPVFRLIYNNPQDPKFDGDRYYAIYQEEIDALLATGKYINEGIVFYGVGNTAGNNPPPSSTPEFGEKTLAYCNENNISRIHLEWTPVPGATLYKIFRSTIEPGSGVKLQELEHFAYNDENIKAHVDYAYYIEAVMPNGSITGKTKILTAVSCP